MNLRLTKIFFYKTDKQKVDLTFNFKGGMSPKGLVSANVLSVYNHYGFAIVVPTVFL